MRSQSGVNVTSPADGSGVSSPVNYAATATSTCAQGVASMGVYVNNKLNYVVNGAKLNTSITLSAGAYDTVVQEWDRCGGSAYKHVKVTVNGSGKSFTNLQASGGWKGYGEYPPKYDICTNCGGGVTWSMGQHVSSPSLSGNATKFSIGSLAPSSAAMRAALDPASGRRALGRLYKRYPAVIAVSVPSIVASARRSASEVDASSRSASCASRTMPRAPAAMHAAPV